jgi:hypothetical protein
MRRKDRLCEIKERIEKWGQSDQSEAEAERFLWRHATKSDDDDGYDDA